MYSSVTIRQIVALLVIALPHASPMAEEKAGLFGYKPGGADAPITGSASAAGAIDAAPSLERCDKPFGTIAVVQPQDHVSAALARFNLPPPNSLLRLMIQQSNCFQVVERGLAMQNLMQERDLARSGQLQAGSNVGAGQMVTADFLLTPEVAFSENNSGGAALGAIGGLFGVAGSVVGAVAAGIKFKQAQTTLLLADSRSGIQVAAAQGSVEKADWGAGGFLGGVGAGAYTNTAEGKVVAAALLDNYNNIVKSIRNMPSLSTPTAGPASAENALAAVKANPFNVGDVVQGKIGGVKVMASPDTNSRLLFSLKKGEEVVVLDGGNGNFLKIQAAAGEGWADARLLRK